MQPADIADVYLAASLIAFVAYGIDKAAAKAGALRIPEQFLHLIALAGGWPGALLAQRAFRHKCGKRSFLITFWLTCGVNVAACFSLFALTGS